MVSTGRQPVEKGRTAGTGARGRGRLSPKDLGAAEFKDLIDQFNWATDRRQPAVVSLTSTRRYLYHSMRPADVGYQTEVAAEMVRRIKGRRVPGEYSRLLTLELVTAIDSDSPMAFDLANNLAGRMRSFSEAHHALDYCTGYWHHEPKLVRVFIERLKALANTEAEQSMVEQLERAI